VATGGQHLRQGSSWSPSSGELSISGLPRITGAVSDKRILFFGDSHVAGVGDPSGLGWVGRLVAASHAAGMPMTAYDLGVRGETFIGVGSHWRHETRARLSSGADTRIVVAFGANDTTIEHGVQRVEALRSCGALSDILEPARAIGLPALVVGPAPVEDAKQNERIRRLSASLGDVCSEHCVTFIDVIDRLLSSRAWMEEVAVDDGAHPGAAGYDALAKHVLESGWLDWLCTPPTATFQSRVCGARQTPSRGVTGSGPRMGAQGSFPRQ
jgi:acyl-CoA thioesterase I